MDSNGSGDFALSISSDMIAEVMEKYFNYSMFKKKVRVVDLQPSKDGYVFVLEYVGNKKPTSPLTYPEAFTENTSIGKPTYDIYVGGGTGMNGEVLPHSKIAEGVTLPFHMGDPLGDPLGDPVIQDALNKVESDMNSETWWDSMIGKTE